MSTPAAIQPSAPTRSSVTIPGTDWATYSRLLRAFADRPGVRLTYDRGVLEIMSPLLAHDRPADFLGALIAVMTEEMGLPIMRGGSTTLRRRRWRRGIEPDRCYWIANEARVRGVQRLDLRVHPPPDLAVEVDVTHSSLNRMGIYAALGVPEVWRWDTAALMFHHLGPAGSYSLATHSAAFPPLTPADLKRFLDLVGREEENMIVRQFRAWVRQHLPPAPPLTP